VTARVRVPAPRKAPDEPAVAGAHRLATSLRSRPTAHTIALAQRLAPRLGVQQVHEITALDHLGLPVFISVRQGGTAVHVHAGKGLAREDALAGALMEAVEYAAVERAGSLPADARLSLSRLVAQWPQGLGPADFAPRLGAALRWRAHTDAWRCEQLQTRQSVLLPGELVLLPQRQGLDVLFGSSSSGLASGNTLEEATLHALLEVLEHDTVALHIARDASRPLAAAALPPPFGAMARAWRRRGVQLRVRWLPNAVGVACFAAELHEPAAAQPRLRLARGWGAHLDRGIALSRAICEAAQARLAAFLAGRPELPGAAAMALRLDGRRVDAQAQMWPARPGEADRPVAFEAVDHERAPSVHEALRWLLARLPAAGLGPVFRRRLWPGGHAAAPRGLHVVKLVVARSETPIGEHPRMGPRLLARLQGG
jgi:ribosomal protein S12 methylthiotransferase accessory factor